MQPLSEGFMILDTSAETGRERREERRREERGERREERGLREQYSTRDGPRTGPVRWQRRGQSATPLAGSLVPNLCNGVQYSD